MKYHFLITCAAIVACAYSASATAQNFQRSAAPNPAIRLAGVQIDSDDSPLDFGFPADSGQHDPQSLPSVDSKSRTPVDSIIENSKSYHQGGVFTATTAYANGQALDGSQFAPLYWSQASYSHTALADYMRLQWCSDGLWDTHSAERAAQCAKQAERISGAHRHRCGHCCQTGVHAYSGHCCQPGHSAGVRSILGGACAECRGNCGWTINGDCPPVNRYRLRDRQRCSDCDQKAACGHPSACDHGSCGGCQPSSEVGEHTSPSQWNAPATSAHSANSWPTAGPLQGQDSTNHGSGGRVAFLPLTATR